MELPAVETPTAPTDSRLAALCATAVYEASRDYQARFHLITRRARERFLARNWAASHADAAERLRLYGAVLNPLVDQIRRLMGTRVEDRAVWAGLKAVYSSLIARCQEWEIGESFFNSLTRRVFATVGVDQQVEFVDSDFDAPPTLPREAAQKGFDGAPLRDLIRWALTKVAFEMRHFADLARDVGLAAERIEGRVKGEINAIEIVKNAFFRAKGAYLVGCLVTDAGTRVPVAFALWNEDAGVRLDAVLLGEDAIAILFSFTRSHFRVDTSRPYELVRFLKGLLPRKRLGELYNALGYHKHGKTEFYRDFMRHLRTSTDCFAAAAGTRGMVMLVFTLPSYDVVFKIIRDSFDPPKDSTRREVMGKYRLVFEHDRAGRLVDAHEFEQIRIERSRFDPALLEDLRTSATQSVRIEAEHVVIQHAYVERRLRPLNLYLPAVDPAAARAAVIDYGQAIKDLAASNIFTGDLLLKNFGVTRQGRVVFYDYDELCWLTDCRFRALPEASSYEEEMSAEPWFTVQENDIFPAEFPSFLGLPSELMQTLKEAHADLFDPAAWRHTQDRIRAGEMIEIFPYGTEAKLAAEGGIF